MMQVHIANIDAGAQDQVGALEAEGVMMGRGTREDGDGQSFVDRKEPAGNSTEN